VASLKEIKTRIASVKNTLKITSAMKLVASAKLHKAQMAIENLLPYSQRLDGIVSNLMQADLSVDKGETGQSASSSGANLLSARSLVSPSTALKRVALVAISSSASLCGGFNNNLIRLATQTIDEYKRQGTDLLLIPIGRKVAQALSTESDYVSIGEKPTYAEAAALAAHLTDLYLSGQVDCVEILYTHYHNMAVQVLMRKQFLPVEVQDSKEQSISLPSLAEGQGEGLLGGGSPFILEPSAPELLSTLLPQALAMRLYAILLDSSAAEHAARTFAMQTATDNGDALLQELNLQFNKVRQQSITNELLDIVGGQMR